MKDLSMIRKTLTALTVAGALALGTASATSLGTFDDVAFAASDVDLLDCQLHPNAIALLPALPDPTALAATDLSDADADTLAAEVAALLDATTAQLGQIQVDLSSLAPACIDDELFTLIVTSVDDVLAVVELGPDDLDDAVDDILTIDAASLVLPNALGVPDVASITQVRMVLSDTAPAAPPAT